jgi:hypothetical protein
MPVRSRPCPLPRVRRDRATLLFTDVRYRLMPWSAKAFGPDEHDKTPGVIGWCPRRRRLALANRSHREEWLTGCCRTAEWADTPQWSGVVGGAATPGSGPAR